MPSVSMLLCKVHSNDPPTTAASALMPPTVVRLTPTKSKPTTSGQSSCVDGPPLSKPRRPASRAVKAAKRSAAPIEAEQVPMSKKQSTRLYAEIASCSSGNTETPHSSQKSAPFAELTNSPAVQSKSSTRPKRAAAAKRPIIDSSESESDGERAAAGRVSEDDAVVGELSDHVCEDEADVGEFSDLDSDSTSRSLDP